MGPEERSKDRVGVQSLRRGWKSYQERKVTSAIRMAPLSYTSLPKANPGPSVRHFETAVSRTDTHTWRLATGPG